MLRKLTCAAVFVVVGLGVAVADEFRATITKIDGNKVTFKKSKKGETGVETTLPVTTDVKVTKGKFNADTKKLDASETLTNGLGNELFTKIGDKGLRVNITTDADNKHITAITIGGGRGGKKKGA